MSKTSTEIEAIISDLQAKHGRVLITRSLDAEVTIDVVGQPSHRYRVSDAVA